ncbi:MAG TPA: hypothetical protein VEO95_05480, partial [Chthoniobacteraceae bacterium]|nr:hypothetical protein [Chthoniobacteraceae bacterium]
MSDILATIDSNRRNGKPRALAMRCALPAALVAVALMLAGCATTHRVKDTSRTFKTVVIDAGHGGIATGTRSRWGGAEKDA